MSSVLERAKLAGKQKADAKKGVQIDFTGKVISAKKLSSAKNAAWEGASLYVDIGETEGEKLIDKLINAEEFEGSKETVERLLEVGQGVSFNPDYNSAAINLFASVSGDKGVKNAGRVLKDDVVSFTAFVSLGTRNLKDGSAVDCLKFNVTKLVQVQNPDEGSLEGAAQGADLA